MDTALEDLAGNKVGRPFEVDNSTGKPSGEPEVISFPLKIQSPVERVSPMRL